VFAAAGRDGQPTYRWPSNVRRSVRAVREQAGLGWMTPHTWRRTYATILDDQMSLTDRAKVDLMGQARFLKTPTSAAVNYTPTPPSSSTPPYVDLPNG
jgi:integrase